ncbi:MAG: thiol-disulfide isomerase [Blastocatellia bacterium]
MRIKRVSSFIAAIALSLVIGFAYVATTKADNTNTKSAKNVTYSKDVAPIFYKSCAECHRPGESAPFSVLAYKELRPWAKSIKEKVANRVMPPWHADPHFGDFKNNPTLTQAEIETIVSWVDAGAVEGNAKDLPPAPKFTEGWGISTPDMIVQIPEEYTYKPGADEYQYFDVPTNFTEDRYITMAEARPGNRKIVHHIIAFIVPKGAPTMAGNPEQRQKMMEMAMKNSPFYRDGFLMRMKADQPVEDDGCGPNARRGGGDNMLVGYAPGRNPDVYAPGTSRKIPAGSTIRFQIHYSNQTLGNSQVEKDRSMIGLVFAKEAPQRLVNTNSVANIFFKIPAGAENHKVTACRQFKRDTTLYALEPHMHLRGKAMQYTAIYPDGKSEVLLDVPKYDFAWQTNYLLKQPKRLPAGTRLMVTGYFDNSAKNKFNPDPSKEVRHGEPTYDEMMMGFIDYVTEMPAVAKLAPELLDKYTGKYEVRPGVLAAVTREGNNLVVQIPMQPKMVFTPMSETAFFLQNSESDLVIVKNDQGEVVEALIGNARAKKVKDATAGGSGQ